MKKILLLIIFGTAAFLFSAGAAVAEEEGITYKFMQGRGVWEVDHISLNEHTNVYIMEDSEDREGTKVYDSRGHEIETDAAKGREYMYVEGPLREDGSIEAEVIYILPHIITEGEWKRYPFIRLPFLPRGR